METSTILPISSDLGIVGNLQRIHPGTNSGRRRRPTPQRRPPGKGRTRTGELTYTPDGHVESDTHGHRVDISA